MIPHLLRPAGPDDFNFVADSWMQSFKRTRTRTEIDAGYGSGHREVVHTLIAECTAIVAQPLDENGEPVPDAIAGWIVGEPLERYVLVHYVYVKNAYRRGGLGRAMLAELVSRATGTGPTRDGRPHLPHVVLTHCTEKWIGNRMRAHGWGFAPNVPFYRVLTVRRRGTAA